jgi:transketolase
MRAILAAYDEARQTKGRPTIVIARTIKGKGVSFMENVCRFHGVAPTKDEASKACGELS